MLFRVQNSLQAISLQRKSTVSISDARVENLLFLSPALSAIKAPSIVPEPHPNKRRTRPKTSWITLNESANVLIAGH